MSSFEMHVILLIYRVENVILKHFYIFFTSVHLLDLNIHVNIMFSAMSNLPYL